MRFALFVTALLWLVAARVAAEHASLGLVTRFQFSAVQPALTEGFFLFLLLVGFATLHWIATHEGGIRRTNSLPSRPTAKREWLIGAVLGWAMLLVAVLPMAIAGDLQPEFLWDGRYWGLTLVSVAAVAFGSLALEVAFRGYLFRRLMEAIGPVAATILSSFLYAVLSNFRPNASALSFCLAFLSGILFSIAYLRTHALWLGWGLHFAWIASMGILFGLPVRGSADYTGIIETSTSGAIWLTGGAFGPDGALLTGIVLIAGMILLYPLTRDFAWDYTHAPIVPGGYAVTIQPPTAHTAMEQAAAAPASLVQISIATPMESSTSPEIVQHLRSQSEEER
jgi:uncharacterized protein